MVRKMKMCVAGNLHVLLRAPSTWLLVGYIMLISDIYIREVRRFCEAVGEPANPVAAPLVLNSSYAVMVFLIGLFLLFLDIPFFHVTADYEIPRIGRRAWLVGQNIYLMVACFAYVAVFELIANSLLLPRLTPELEWGRVFTTLARTSAGSEFYTAMNLDYGMMARFDAGEAVLIHYLIASGVCVLYANMLFTLNLWTSRIFAAAVTGCGILFPWVTEILNFNWKYIVSPISWLQMSRIDRIMTNTVPSICFIAAVLVGVNVLLFLFNWVRIRRLEWRRKEEIV